MPRTRRSSDAALKELRAFGLAYPGAHTKSPWPGHLDLAVNDKTFAYLSLEGEPFGISCKLPRSSSIALMLEWVKPSAYGLGKSGWVSASPPEDEPVPVELFKEWLDESYRAQAPRKLVRQLDGGAPAASAKPVAAKAATAKPAAAKPAARSTRTARTARSAAKSPRKPSVSGTKKRARR